MITGLPQSSGPLRLAVVSDIHYASQAEQQRKNYLYQGLTNRAGRALLKAYRHFVWLRDPFAHNHLLDEFINRAANADLVVANGDYSCDSAFIGVSDTAAFASARECLQKLRERFGSRFLAVIGDHEIGKSSLGGGLGGPRLASLQRAETGLGLPPLWHVTLGHYVLIGVTCTLAAFPVFEAEALPEERPAWRRLHQAHLAAVRQIFAGLKSDQRVLLFCHDPTALPFLWRDDVVRQKLSHVALTVIGHLHTPLVLFKSRLLAGLPVIRFLGTTPRRLSTALNEARHWKPFNIRLCPALAGTELFKDGGYCTIELDTEAKRPLRFQFHPIRR